MASFDAFILVTERRVDESDVWIYNEIRHRLNKPVFLVRNKINFDIQQVGRTAANWLPPPLLTPWWLVAWGLGTR